MSEEKKEEVKEQKAAAPKAEKKEEAPKPEKAQKKEEPKAKPEAAPAKASAPSEGEAGPKRPKVSQLSLNEVEEEIQKCQEKMGGLYSKYARFLVRRKQLLSSRGK